MNKNSLLAAVSRAPWRAVARQALLRAGFELITGKSESFALIKSFPDTDPRFAELERIVAEMLTVSEKSVRLYKINRSEIAKIRKWISGKRRTSNDLTNAYPGVAGEQVRRAAPINELTSLGSQEMAVGIDALFTGIQEFLEREEIPLSDVRDHKEFERVYGQRRIFWQTFGCLWLPGLAVSNQEILVSISDQPEKAPKDFAHTYHDAMASELRRGIGVAVEPLNLFDAVQNLHNKPEGSLILHGFINNADGVKYHKGRKDLRKDAYDVAGAAAVGPALQPFRIGVKWVLTNSQRTVRSTPTLQLLGTSRILTKPIPTINDAIVGNCIDSHDMKFVISRLIANL